jgi:predicted alpha/beta hydrolase
MDVDITTSDGATLRGTLYEASGDRAIVIAGAMGAPRRYYDAFARYAAERGFTVLTFDYRGMGESKHDHAKLADWGRFDIPAAIDFVKPRAVTLIAQSVGGQVAGMAPNLTSVQRIVFVAAQSGYWRLWTGLRRYRIGLLWLLMLSVTRILGFFPARFVGLGRENLPRDVAIEWARWIRHPDYQFGFGQQIDLRGYASYGGPMLAWSFDDDGLAPRLNVEVLLRRYSGASIDHRHVIEHGVGHFGFFRSGIGEPFWDQTLDWMRSP